MARKPLTFKFRHHILFLIALGIIFAGFILLDSSSSSKTHKALLNLQKDDKDNDDTLAVQNAQRLENFTRALVYLFLPFIMYPFVSR